MDAVPEDLRVAEDAPGRLHPEEAGPRQTAAAAARGARKRPRI